MLQKRNKRREAGDVHEKVSFVGLHFQKVHVIGVYLQHEHDNMGHQIQAAAPGYELIFNDPAIFNTHFCWSSSIYPWHRVCKNSEKRNKHFNFSSLPAAAAAKRMILIPKKYVIRERGNCKTNLYKRPHVLNLLLLPAFHFMLKEGELSVMCP